MTSMKSLFLASSALLAAATVMPAQATPAAPILKVAQAQGDSAAADKKAGDKKENKKAETGPTDQKKESGKEHKGRAGKGAAPDNAKAAPSKESKPAAAAQQKKSAPAGKPAPAAAAEKKAPPPKKPEKPENKQAAPASKKEAAPGAQPTPKQQPTAQQKKQPPKQQPADKQDKAEQKQQPAKQQGQPESKQQATEQKKPSEPSAQQAAPTEGADKSAPSKSAAPAPSGKGDAAAATEQQLEPAKPQDAREFIRRDGGKPERTIKDIREHRRTTREGGRTFIHEGDRVIVRDNNRAFIRHNEERRFAVGARDVRTDHRNGETVTVVIRPNGARIVTVTDRQGHLVRRMRRNPNGHDVVIIDNRHRGRRDVFIDVRRPHIGMPRERYIVDADRANREEIYDVLAAPPVQTIERDYSLAQVRYNAPLREYMRRLDLDIHFDTGSWQITPAQMDRLSVVAAALNQAIERNPREVFLIEGHTDAIGSVEDNLSLSDRRAEAVAVALTETFQVPPENLVTQGYGEGELKVETQEATRANRRVALRRITPLINRTAGR